MSFLLRLLSPFSSAKSASVKIYDSLLTVTNPSAILDDVYTATTTTGRFLPPSYSKVADYQWFYFNILREMNEDEHRSSSFLNAVTSETTRNHLFECLPLPLDEVSFRLLFDYKLNSRLSPETIRKAVLSDRSFSCLSRAS